MVVLFAVSDVIKALGAVLFVGGLGLYFWIEYRQKKQASTQGVSLVGWIVQANNDLFRPGRQNLPAQLLISFQVPNGIGLQQLAERMFRLKSESPANEAERAVAVEVRDERTPVGQKISTSARVYRRPKSLCGRRHDRKASPTRATVDRTLGPMSGNARR